MITCMSEVAKPAEVVPDFGPPSRQLSARRSLPMRLPTGVRPPLVQTFLLLLSLPRAKPITVGPDTKPHVNGNRILLDGGVHAWQGPSTDVLSPIQDAETGKRGNPKWGNLPRKFNIAVSGSRDDFAHTHINDIGFQPVVHAGLTGSAKPKIQAGSAILLPLLSFPLFSCYVFCQQNRTRVFVFRIFVFSFASKALAVDNT